MKNHWALEFYNLAESRGIKCRIEKLINGWIETINCSGKEYFTKSATYDLSRKQYFQGVDPPKMNENGAFVLFCGGRRDILTDIFIIPWDIFFKTLGMGKPINTYRPPKEYFQYKFYLRDRDGCWHMSVQGRKRPVLDVTNWHYAVFKALSLIDSA
jgi:hypothetical protein